MMHAYITHHPHPHAHNHAHGIQTYSVYSEVSLKAIIYYLLCLQYPEV